MSPPMSPCDQFDPQFQNNFFLRLSFSPPRSPVKTETKVSSREKTQFGTTACSHVVNFCLY